jgi:hypothetical protein
MALRICDPHVHMYARVTDDYERMALAGIELIIEPAFWLGEPRKYAGSFFDYFEHLHNYETTRAAQFGVDHYVTFALNPREANDPKLPERGFANGQFILIRREAYAAAGGNASVRGRVLEDVEFARQVKRAGKRLYLGYGQALFGTRMYRDLASFHEGWSKNLFLLMGRKWGRSIVAVMSSMLLAWVPLIALIRGVHAIATHDTSLPVWGPAVLVASYFVMTIFQITLRTIGNAFPAFSFLAPFGSMMTSWLVMRSAWLTTFGKGVSWKGRTYVD